MSSSALPIQAASIWPRSIPASASASSKASTIRSSGPWSQRSPNVVQPMPMIATLSLIPLAMGLAFDGRALRRRRLPEIGSEAALVIMRFDPQAHPHRIADGESLGVGVGEFHHHPGAIFKLHEPEPERRIGGEVETVRGDRDDARGKVGESDVLQRLRPNRIRTDGDAAFGELDVSRLVASADEADHVASVAFERGGLRLLFKFRAHAPIAI